MLASEQYDRNNFCRQRLNLLFDCGELGLVIFLVRFVDFGDGWAGDGGVGCGGVDYWGGRAVEEGCF